VRESTSIKKYPATYTNPDAWTSPANALGVEDGLCTRKNTVALSDKLLPFLNLPTKAYGFNLPAGAILDNIFLSHLGISSANTTPGLVFEWVSTVPTNITFSDDSSGTLLGANCASCAWVAETDILPSLKSNGRAPSISDLNSETGWYTELRATPDRNSAESFFVDAAYVRIVYHLPSVSTHMGDGLVCTTINNNNNKPPRGRPHSGQQKSPLGALLLLLFRTT
jgi:hypothetical protein